MWYNVTERSVTMEEKETKQTKWQKYKDKMYATNERYHSKFQQVKFYCEPDLYEEVKAYCAAKGISMSQFIKDSMRRGMES